ncbi:hypothetical protein [Nocardia pseudovaccinii]|uniref:hypothetical protein n=1 Tax=Nocardia pseudovaccinii TaxID=189540 RepID=UPI0007A54077|nr:hypothetical protein [Nocardia pseudovaccinii]
MILGSAYRSNGDFGQVLESPGYQLLEAFVRTVVAQSGRPGARIQFMLLTTRPQPEMSTLQVILVSEISATGVGR